MENRRKTIFTFGVILLFGIGIIFTIGILNNSSEGYMDEIFLKSLPDDLVVNNFESGFIYNYSNFDPQSLNVLPNTTQRVYILDGFDSNNDFSNFSLEIWPSIKLFPFNTSIDGDSNNYTINYINSSKFNHVIRRQHMRIINEDLNSSILIGYEDSYDSYFTGINFQDFYYMPINIKNSFLNRSFAQENDIEENIRSFIMYPLKHMNLSDIKYSISLDSCPTFLVYDSYYFIQFDNQTSSCIFQYQFDYLLGKIEFHQNDTDEENSGIKCIVQLYRHQTQSYLN